MEVRIDWTILCILGPQNFRGLVFELFGQHIKPNLAADRAMQVDRKKDADV